MKEMTIQEQAKATRNKNTLKDTKKEDKKVTKISFLLLQLTALSSLINLTKQANFALVGPVSSGKVYFNDRPANQGPSNEFFSVCTSATQCFILNKTTQVYTNNALNAAFVYSSPRVNKTLITGFVTELVTVAANNQATKKALTNPARILKCVFSHGLKWICQDGTTGSYVLWNVQTEASDFTYANTISTTLAQVNNKACSVVDSAGTQLYCARLGNNFNKLFALNETNGGGVPTYSGNFTFPSNAVGSSYFEGLLAVYSASPVSVRIGNYATGVMMTSWTNTSLTGNAQTCADMRLGIIAVPTATDTKILALSNGNQIAAIRTSQNIEFSEVHDLMYFVQNPSNQYAYYRITYSNPVANCQKFSLGVGTCLQCATNYTLNNTVLLSSSCNPVPAPTPPPTPNNTNTTTPNTTTNTNATVTGNGTTNPSNISLKHGNATFIPGSTFTPSFGQLVSDLGTIEFLNLSSLNNTKKREYIEGFVFRSNSSNFTNRFDFQNLAAPTWNVSDFIRFEVQNFTEYFEQGIIPIKMIFLRSMESFSGRMAIIDTGNFTSNPTTTPTTTTTSTSTTSNTPTSGGTPLSANKNPRPDTRRILQNTANFKPVQMPPVWKPQLDPTVTARVLARIIKFIITLLQIYLCFVRVFIEKLRNKWTLWFASTVMALQSLLLIGGISGNFGGVIDSIQIEMLKAFQYFLFFIDPTLTLSTQFNQRVRLAGLRKFQTALYSASPIQQHPVELFLLVAALAFQIVGQFVRRLTRLAKNIRAGVTMSTMIPLLLSSILNLYVFVTVSNIPTFGIFSTVVSAFLIIYFFFDTLISVFGVGWNNRHTRGAYPGLGGLKPRVDGEEANSENDAGPQGFDPNRDPNELRNNSNYLLVDGSGASFDIDEHNKFGERRIANYAEIVIYFLYPFVLVTMLSTRLVHPLSVGLVFLILLAYVLVLRLRRIGKLTFEKSTDNLAWIYFYKPIGLAWRLLSYAALVFLWAIKSSLSLLYIQIVTTFFVTFVIFDGVFNLITLGHRIYEVYVGWYQVDYDLAGEVAKERSTPPSNKQDKMNNSNQSTATPGAARRPIVPSYSPSTNRELARDLGATTPGYNPNLNLAGNPSMPAATIPFVPYNGPITANPQQLQFARNRSRLP